MKYKQRKNTTCIYHPTGVLCPSAASCGDRGWNPRVEADRKEIIRALRVEALYGAQENTEEETENASL